MGSKRAVPGRISLPLVLLVLASLLPATSAEAAFPGTNGRIAFSTNRDGNFEIYTMNSDGTGVARLTNDSRPDYCPHWSPDGRMIVWERDGGSIWLMNYDGTNQRQLPGGVDNWGQCPAWSPDGTQIVYSRYDGHYETAIYVVNADGSGRHAVSSASWLYSPYWPSWSPNGQKIAFTGYDFNDYSRVWVVNPDGTGETQITFDAGDFIPDCCPDWSPDSSKIIFNGARGVETINPDGTGRTLVTDQAFGPPAWSPDGTKFAVSSSDGSDQEIYTYNADGSGQVQITNFSSSDVGPDWQPTPAQPPRGPARPKTATPTTVRLVPAQEACTSPNASHGAPLAVSSCSPPRQSSEYLTVGTGDGSSHAANSRGILTMKAVGEVPLNLTNGDQSDVALTISITDVRCLDVSGGCGPSGSDYGGELLASFPLRLTDRYSGSGGVHPATTVDASFAFSFSCAPTPDPPSIGSNCSAATSADAAMPGIAIEGRRAMWQMGQIEVYDGGNDADGATTGDNTLFLTQGLFTP